jgi:hypothetical protein
VDRARGFGIRFAGKLMIGEKVRREKPLGISGCNSRPELVGSTAAPTALGDQRAKREIG